MSSAAAVLAKWTEPLGIEEFRRGILGRSAWAQPHSARSAVEVLTWSALEEILSAKPAADVIVCSGGHQLPLPVPRDLTEMRAYLRMGVGLAMRHTQRCHPLLDAIAREFEAVLPGTAQVQIFVTPARTHGFGWHYDAEDVFIAQTVGCKDYYFRENTVEVDTPFPPRDFSAYGRETSALRTACLVPGDFLYIPARWWHMAWCREDSLSISVGVMPPKTS